MIYLIPVIASAAAALLRLRTRTLWLLVFACLLVNPVVTQWWGLYHYVLGARYFDDVGYFDLYECTSYLMDAPTRRDLNTYDFRFDEAECDMRPGRAALLMLDLHRFDFRDGMLTDKGLNATPAWIATFGALVNLPLSVLLIIDPLALLAAVVAVGRFVGWRQAAYASLFILAFYGTFGRLWGHYAQWVWLALVLVGVAVLRWRAWGAALLGAAAALFVFPGFLVLTLRTRRALVWFALGAGVLLIAGLFTSRGPGAYLEFIENMRLHSSYIRSEPYNIGLHNTVTMIANPDTQAAYRECFTLGDCVERYEYQPAKGLWALLTPLVVWTWPGLMFALMTLSRYYWLILAVLAITNERHARALLAVNAVLFMWYLLSWDTVYTWGHLLWVGFFIYMGKDNAQKLASILLPQGAQAGPRAASIRR